MATNNTTTNTTTSSTTRTKKKDDFCRLDSANNTVMVALRAEEAEGDMYRRLAMTTSSSGPHGYYFTAGTGTSSMRRFSEQPRGSHTFEEAPSLSTRLLLPSQQQQQQKQQPGSPSTEQQRTSSSSITSTDNNIVLPACHVSHVSTIPIPPFLTKEISTKARVSSLMGLLPEANLAWMSVDSTCYLWSYDFLAPSSSNNYSDFCSFTVPSQQCVTSVGIAKPKPGIFIAQVTWVLIIATPDEVLLCALASSSSSSSEQDGLFGPNLKLIPTTFTLPTDGASVYVVKSTSEGRIFLGTSDGNLLEFCYELSKTTTATPTTDTDDDDEDDEQEQYLTNPSSWTSTVVSGSKRILSEFLFSSSTTTAPPRKKTCRRVNHTQPSLLATLVPSFFHSLFFLSNKGDGSAIVDIAIDEDRCYIHVLNANGILYTFENKKEVSLLQQLHLPKISKQYLESLTRVSYASESHYYTFAGGVTCALAALGAIEGVKAILKVIFTTDYSNKRRSNHGILHPLRAFVIPPSMSSKILLTLVTEGGFRMYIASDANNKFQLCHLRAPPSSYNATGDVSAAAAPVAPGVLLTSFRRGNRQYKVPAATVASYYDTMNQSLILGLDGYAGLDENEESQYTGDALLVCSSDLAIRGNTTTDSEERNAPATATSRTKGCNNEVISTPSESGIVTGGRMWQITGSSEVENSALFRLVRHSTTPTPTVFENDLKKHVPACPPIVLFRNIHNKKKKYKLIKSSERENRKTPKAIVHDDSITSTTPLPLAAQHVYKFLHNNMNDNDFLILNSGGIHVYKVTSILELFAQVIDNQDTTATKHLIAAYGQAEVCNMSLAIAIAPQTNADLMERAKRTALAHGGRPTMQEDTTGPTLMSTSTQSLLFRPSALHQGLVILSARLLRPIWFKPFVVVTAPPALKSKRVTIGGKHQPPRFKAHLVDFLFDPNLLLKELKALLNLMRDIFAPAINCVPGRKKEGDGSTSMDVDELTFSPDHINTGRQFGYVTSALQFRHQSSSHPQVEDRQAMARLSEETSIHNIYRLLSRTAQALTLLNILRRYDDANQTSNSYNAVEWGFLHKLTLYQIVCLPEAADRVAALLQAIFFSSSPAASLTDYYFERSTSSSNQMAQELSSHCYLFFSKPDYISQEAMVASNAARGEIPGSETFRTLSNRAATLWTNAAACWQSERLVTGKILQTHPSTFENKANKGNVFQFPEDVETLAFSSIYSTSPLVKACVALFSISNVAGIVDVCLTCAANFGGTAVGTRGENVVGKIKNALFQPNNASALLSWEDGLYLTGSTTQDNVTDLTSPSSKSTANNARRLFSAQSGPRSESPSATTTGMMSTALVVSSEAFDATSPTYARKFCYSLLLYFLNLLLLRQKNEAATPDIQRSNGGYNYPSPVVSLAETMLSVCTASEDQYFHFMLYEFLLSSDRASTLLRLQTPFLEDWLAKNATDDESQLLYRYYVVHQRHDLASSVMEQKASTETENVPLEKRIEFLTRAIGSASAAVEASSGGGGSDPSLKLSELQDKLEIASLQKKILSSLPGLDEMTLDADQCQALTFKLVPVSDLFNVYAAPLELYEICLLIMNVCKTNDLDTIITLWKRIISRELQGVFSERPDVQDILLMLKEDADLVDGSVNPEEIEFESGEWIRPLKEKVANLAKQLWGKGADFTVPLSFLVPLLEGLRQAFLASSDGGRIQSLVSLEALHWPILSLCKAGIPYSTVLECYRMILSEKEREGDSDGSFQYLRCISEILTQWIKSAYSARSNSVAYSGNDKSYVEGQTFSEDSAVQLVRARSAGLLNLIDNYKLSLEAMVGRSREADKVLNIFTSIEAALKSF